MGSEVHGVTLKHDFLTMAYEAALDNMFPTPEGEARKAAKRANHEAEWATKTAAGLVGIRDEGDFGEPSDWRAASRDYVQRWVPKAAWERYLQACEALDDAEAEMLK
jgi:hypothetical protein